MVEPAGADCRVATHVAGAVNAARWRSGGAVDCNRRRPWGRWRAAECSASTVRQATIDDAQDNLPRVEASGWIAEHEHKPCRRHHIWVRGGGAQGECNGPVDEPFCGCQTATASPDGVTSPDGNRAPTGRSDGSVASHYSQASDGGGVRLVEVRRRLLKRVEGADGGLGHSEILWAEEAGVAAAKASLTNHRHHTSEKCSKRRAGVSCANAI